MKSVADLIANKEALIKRNKRGKITAAAVAAAGASVIAAAQAEAGSVDGFEDITSSVVSFERLGNGQIEFELENGQRFIASEGQYIIDGNEIMVSSELVTVVNGPGMNTMVARGRCRRSAAGRPADFQTAERRLLRAPARFKFIFLHVQQVRR